MPMKAAKGLESMPSGLLFAGWAETPLRSSTQRRPAAGDVSASSHWNASCAFLLLAETAAKVPLPTGSA